MLKSIFFTTAGLIARILLTYAWLIGFGICSEELETLAAMLCGSLLIGLFYVVHIRIRLPKKWTYDRLKFTVPKYRFLLIIITLILVVGDFFWIFHIKTSQSTFTDDPLDVLFLAIVAYPLVEEFGFRLWLQSYLETKINEITAVLSISLFFASIHATEIPITQLLSGIFYGIVLIYTKSVWWPIMVHVLHNGLIILVEQIPFVKKQAFILMDRQDNLNLIVAILFWSLASLGLFIWVKQNQNTNKMEEQ